jgi:hypothetical protein
VEVTQEIIDRSAVRDSSHCMIAEAVKAAYPTATYISVDLATIRFTDESAGFRYIYLTPQKAQAALLDFDQGDKPAPFSFRTRAAQIMRSGRKSGSGSRAATLQPNDGSDRVPVKIGGDLPPVGPLVGGRPGGGSRTGRRRAFGLRAIIR